MFFHPAFPSRMGRAVILAGSFALSGIPIIGRADTSDQVQVTVTVRPHRVPAQPFRFAGDPGDGCTGVTELPAMARGLAGDGSLVLWAAGDPGDGCIAPEDLAVGGGEPGAPFTQLAAGMGMILPTLGEAPLLLRFRPTWRYRQGTYEARLKLVPESGGEEVPITLSAEVPAFLQCRAAGVVETGDGFREYLFRVSTNGERWEVRLNRDAAWELRKQPREVAVVSVQKGLIIGRGPVQDLVLVIRVPKGQSPVRASGRTRP